MPRSLVGSHDKDDGEGDANDVNALATKAAAFLAGTAAFHATAYASQLVQLRVLGISTGTRPIILPISIGMMTVAFGSFAGHVAGLGASRALLSGGSRGGGGRSNYYASSSPRRSLSERGGMALTSMREMTRPMFLGIAMGGNDNVGGLSIRDRRERKEAWMHAARICILGMLTYKIVFRMRYSSISPSSYTARGSFARIGIPAPSNFDYATPSQRMRIERLGRAFGCHTCGSRMIFSNKFGSVRTNGPKFHGDHIPPVSVARQLNDRWYRRWFGLKVSQRFYPQCRNCSNKQGGLLSRAVNAGSRNLRAVGGGVESHFHGIRPRIGHMTGGVVAVLSISGGDGDRDDLVMSSRKRVRRWQDWIEDAGMKARERMLNSWRDGR